MTKLSSSPDRHTFTKDNYIKRAQERGENLDSDEFKLILELFKTERERIIEREADPTWSVNNLEYDLRSTEWIIDKVRLDDNYAQNLYAALCNNDFQKLAVIPILTNAVWSCSWRYAGGIVADMRGEGDYVNWYCSGISDGHGITTKYVNEGTVTPDVKQDLHKLGWIVKND
jgi:hypothetical protein